MNMEMWYRLRDDGVGEGENPLCLIGLHHRPSRRLGVGHDQCCEVGWRNQQVLHMGPRDNQGVPQEDRSMVEQYRCIAIDGDDVGIVRMRDQIAERAGHV
jgi:hypothetical protein